MSPTLSIAISLLGSVVRTDRYCHELEAMACITVIIVIRVHMCRTSWRHILVRFWGGILGNSMSPQSTRKHKNKVKEKVSVQEDKRKRRKLRGTCGGLQFCHRCVSPFNYSVPGFYEHTISFEWPSFLLQTFFPWKKSVA